MRAILLTGTALLVWYYSSKAVHDIIVWGAFIAALPRARRALSAWNNPAGYAFGAVLLFTVAGLPLSLDAAASSRDLIRWMRLPAGAFALAVLLDTPGRVFTALWHSALAITLVLAADLARLCLVLRGGILAEAHAHQPFMLNHSNVSSLLAAACVIIFAAAAFRALPEDANRGRRIIAGAGMAVGLIYLFVLASRGPQAAFLAVVAAAGALRMPGRRRLAWMAVVLLVAVLTVALNPRFRDRGQMVSLAGRTAVWEHTWMLGRQRPWLGHGFGKRVFQDVYRNTDPPTPPPPYEAIEYPHPHSYALFIFFQHGLPGLGLYGLAWGLLALRLANAIRNKTSRHPYGGLPGLTAMLLVLLHVYGLGDFPDNRLAMLMVWLIPAALTAAKSPHADIPPPTG